MHSLPVSPRVIQPTSTSAGAGLVVLSVLLIGTGSVYGVDRIERWRPHLQPRVPFVLDRQGPSTTRDELPHLDLRGAVEHLANIRYVLNPAVADLAALFEVSRQAVYKWLSGVSTPEPDNFKRIEALSRIADAFTAEAIPRGGELLKMKTFEGRSLLDLIKSGDNRPEHVTALIAEAKAMEAAYQKSGLATSKAKPTRDWQTSLSIPGSSERV